MKTRKLGYTELQLSTIGLGTHAIGGGENPIGWGPQDDKDSIATIQKAIDIGVNWLDTAPVYGLGKSETIVGKAIKGYRDKVILATKTAVTWKEENGKITFPRSHKAESVRRQVEDSLKRLDVEVIDLLQIHWPPVPDDDLEESWRTIAKLVEKGKVRYIGVSNMNRSQLERLLTIHPIASLQPPYSMITRGIEQELVPFCVSHQIGIVPYSPLERGILTGAVTRERILSMPDDDHRKRANPFQEPEISANLALVEELREVALLLNISLAQLAIGWALKQPGITSVIVGARHPQQILETALAGNMELTDDVLATVEVCLARRVAKLNQIRRDS